MQSLLCFTCVALLVAFGASELSPTLAKYYCLYNGVYTNREDVQRYPGSGLTPVQFRVRSVYIPGLSQNPVTFIEQSDNGQVVVAEIGIVTEDANGRIQVEPYNFTDYRGKKPGEININDYLNYTRDQLQENPGCGGSMQLIDNSYFLGNLPDCRHALKNGVHRDYSASLTCDAISVAVPAGAAEKQVSGEYTLKREGPKFPLPDSNYTCDCNQTSA